MLFCSHFIYCFVCIGSLNLKNLYEYLLFHLQLYYFNQQKKIVDALLFMFHLLFCIQRQLKLEEFMGRVILSFLVILWSSYSRRVVHYVMLVCQLYCLVDVLLFSLHLLYYMYRYLELEEEFVRVISSLVILDLLTVSVLFIM